LQPRPGPQSQQKKMAASLVRGIAPKRAAGHVVKKRKKRGPKKRSKRGKQLHVVYDELLTKGGSSRAEGAEGKNMKVREKTHVEGAVFHPRMFVRRSPGEKKHHTPAGEKGKKPKY